MVSGVGSGVRVAVGTRIAAGSCVGIAVGASVRVGVGARIAAGSGVDVAIGPGVRVGSGVGIGVVGVAVGCSGVALGGGAGAGGVDSLVHEARMRMDARNPVRMMNRFNEPPILMAEHCSKENHRFVNH